MNPLDPNQFNMPVPAYPGGPDPRFGPFFDGRHVYNPTTHPYLNTLFGVTNAMQDLSFGYATLNAQMAGYNPAMDPNLAYANAVVNPALNNAHNLYNTAQQGIQQAGGGHGGEAGAQAGEKSGPNVTGALTGAAGGAVIGSMVGGFPIGTAVGGVIGGLVGLFS